MTHQTEESHAGRPDVGFESSGRYPLTSAHKTQDSGHNPFRETALAYLDAGFTPIVLPHKKKHPPETGVTGWAGRIPTVNDVADWLVHRPPASNIGIRLHGDQVGIDVDAYKEAGAESWAAAVDAHGEPPPTWISTARDLPSGVRLYRWPHPITQDAKPVNLPGIETLHHGHRYICAPPSWNPKSGSWYRWIRPDGTDAPRGELPKADEIPTLPAGWVDHFTESCKCFAKASPTVTFEWSRYRGGGPEGPIRKVLDEFHQKFAGSRHDATTRAVAAVHVLQQWPGADDARREIESAFLNAVTGDRSRGQREAEGELHRMWKDVDKFDIIPFDSTRTRSAPAPAATDDADFWTARPELERIRTYAQAQMAAPHAVLAVALARIICQTPAAIVLPDIIYDYASLNQTIALVADSGGGKGGSSAVGATAVDVGPVKFSTHTLGTGQGIAHGYAHHEKGVTVQHADSVLFTVEEVDHLAAHNNQTGSTTLAELRRFGMGEKLGHLYVDPKRRIEVAAHSYRGAVIVAVQPARAAVILDAADGGTPQRFYWTPTVDPHPPTVEPERPDPWRWQRPRTLPDVGRGFRPIPVCSVAVDAIKQAQRDRRDGKGDPLDGHALLTRERLAAALGILAGRYEITDEDWQLAGHMMDNSAATRSRVVERLADKKRDANRQRGEYDAERSVIVSEAVEDAAVKRVVRNLARHLPSDGIPRHELRKKLPSRDRVYFEDAAERLLEAGLIEALETDHGTSYRKVEK